VAWGNLLLLMDDIASALDDVALMTKVAASKTAAVVGDDLALNAQQLTGIAADRELRVVWGVAKGSLRNKLLLVPTALVVSALAPTLVLPLLVIGGCYLCYEGMEKLTHRRSVGVNAPAGIAQAVAEKDRIRGAVRTDFILSAEIIVIALGTVATAPALTRIGVLLCVGLLMTVGVYGLVAAIVKIDDCGLYLSQVRRFGVLGLVLRTVGRYLVGTAPWLMRLLSVSGTIAMFVVGGGILIHGLTPLHAIAKHGRALLIAAGVPATLGTQFASLLADVLTGLVAGTILLCLAGLIRLIRSHR